MKTMWRQLEIKIKSITNLFALQTQKGTEQQTQHRQEFNYNMTYCLTS